MAAQRKGNYQPSPVLSTVNMAETLRLAGPSVDDREKAKEEEKMSIFWRIFGGTVLSIMVTVLVTVYQQVSGTLDGLRTDQHRLTEAQADYAKNADLASKATQLWTAQKQTAEEVPALRTRASQLEGQVRTLEQDRKELQQQLQQLRERLVRVEALQTTPTSATSAPTPRMAGIED